MKVVGGMKWQRSKKEGGGQISVQLKGNELCRMQARLVQSWDPAGDVWDG